MSVWTGYFLAAAALAFLLTPFAAWVAARAGAVDQPAARKVHVRPIPRLGGLAIFGSVVLCLGAAIGLSPELWGASPWPSVIVGSLIVYLLGFTDDVNPLGARLKLAVQILAAMIAVQGGIRLDDVLLPSGERLNLGIFGVPLTVFWIVGVTNAFNLIDGLDGLAGGLALIASFTLFFLGRGGDAGMALVAVILAGALTGFLRYNFHPARIFMGDSGSLFVGFLIACMSVRASIAASPLGFVAPFLAVAVPVLDTLTTMARRYISSVASQRGRRLRAALGVGVVFEPDRGHIHHRLLDSGLTQRQAVTVLYLLGLVLAVLAVATRRIGAELMLWLPAAGIGLFLILRTLVRARTQH